MNAADNKQRDPKMDTIKIEIKPDDNVISVMNNGKGIPVVMHKDENMYVPTMIFGHLLTSSNFNDEDQKVKKNIVKQRARRTKGEVSIVYRIICLK